MEATGARTLSGSEPGLTQGSLPASLLTYLAVPAGLDPLGPWAGPEGFDEGNKAAQPQCVRVRSEAKRLQQAPWGATGVAACVCVCRFPQGTAHVTQ